MNNEVIEFLRQNAKKGGQAVLAKYGKEYFSENGKKSGIARLGKKRGKYKKKEQDSEVVKQ